MEDAEVTESMRLQRLNVFSMPALQRNLEELEFFLVEHELGKHLAFVKWVKGYLSLVVLIPFDWHPCLL